MCLIVSFTLYGTARSSNTYTLRYLTSRRGISVRRLYTAYLGAGPKSGMLCYVVFIQSRLR